MRGKKMVIAVSVIVVVLLCCLLYSLCQGHKPVATVSALERKPAGRILVACFSESKTKSTLTMARWIQGMVGGDLMEIEPETPYPESYAMTVKQAHKEINEKFQPVLKPLDKKAEDYDIVFIGTPVWFGTFAPPIRSFLAESKLVGKTVVPFCTHGGGGASETFKDLAAELTDATVLEGLALRGPNVVQRKMGKGVEYFAYPDDVRNWLMKLDLGWAEKTNP